MGKYIQTLITPYLKKNKSIRKEDLNSTKDSHFENESTAFQQAVKIEETKLKVESKVFEIKILPQIENQQIQENRERRHGQLLLTEMGFKTTGNQKPFHRMCAQCGLKLSNHKSKQLGRGPICFKKHMARKQRK